MAKASEQGPMTGVTPHLTVKGAKKAVEFYKKAFGAKLQFSMPADDGKRLMHAHLVVNGASLMLADDFPEYRGGKVAPNPAGVVLHLQVKDADKWFNRAVEAGAKVAMPLADQFWGDRYGQVADPFGHVWSIGAPSKKAAKKAGPMPSVKKAAAPAKKNAKKAAKRM